MVDLEELAREAFARRRAPARGLAGAAETIADACGAMATRFADGGKLLAFGNGGPSTDAQHISVEFVHPVIVGKPALPALSLVTDAATVMGVARRSGLDEVFAHQLDVLGEADDIALGISPDGHCGNVLRGLEHAHAAGLLTVALLGGDGGAIATSDAVDHVVVVDSDDPHVVKEVHVTAYHVLWELVHAFLEDRADAGGRSAGDDVRALYPSVYGGRGAETLHAEVARSTREKAGQIVELRERVAADWPAAIAACATDLGARFADGGKLLSFGNGGSSSDAQEVAQSFLDPTRGDLRALPALCLSNDIAVLTALSNDVDFDVVFARQVRAFGKAKDAVLGLSTSGNSPNVLNAFVAAKERGMLTIGLAGSDGGAMAAADGIDHLFVVPSDSVHRIQEVQTTLYHVLRELTAAAMAA